jgi:hypothetical protein
LRGGAALKNKWRSKQEKQKEKREQLNHYDASEKSKIVVNISNNKY